MKCLFIILLPLVLYAIGYATETHAVWQMTKLGLIKDQIVVVFFPIVYARVDLFCTVGLQKQVHNTNIISLIVHFHILYNQRQKIKWIRLAIKFIN